MQSLKKSSSSEPDKNVDADSEAPLRIPILVDSNMLEANAKGFKDIAERFVDPETFKASLKVVTGAVSTLISDVAAVGAFKLDEITIGLTVDAEGRVALIGSASIEASIELKFKK